MKKNYFTILFATFSFAMFAQVTVVKDTLRAGAVAVFNVEYTAVASSTGVTFTLNIEAAAGQITDIQEVEVYKSYGDNRVSGRVRIQRYLDASTGTVVFTDDSDQYTEDAGSPTGFTGDGAFVVGTPIAYSVKVILNDGSNVNSQRTVPSVYYTGAPDAVVNDVVNDNMVLQTRVYENYPTEETALVVIALAPSVNYPTDPYALLADASLARQNPGYVNWQSYPAFVSEIMYNEVASLSGRQRDLPSSTAFWSNEGVTFHLVKKANIRPDASDGSSNIAADGTTNMSLKLGRPNSSQPNDGNSFSYNSTVSTPITITGVLSVDDVNSVSTTVRAIENRISVSNVTLETEINIYNVLGALVKSFTTNEDVDFEFNSGLYIAKITTTEGEKSVKLLVQ